MSHDLVAIGASAGGFHALGVILSSLPRELPLPIVCVVHRHPSSSVGLVEGLQRQTERMVIDCEDKEPREPGHVYLAPASYHLLVEGDGFALTTDAPVKYARPSIDVFFTSAAEALGPGVIGVVLTGANNDGAEGAAVIKARGGLVIVQDPETAEVSSMPNAVVEAGVADHVVPLEDIAGCLCECWKRGVENQGPWM